MSAIRAVLAPAPLSLALARSASPASETDAQDGAFALRDVEAARRCLADLPAEGGSRFEAARWAREPLFQPAAVAELVDPLRLLAPVMRAGPRGSGRWRSISWREALDRIARRRPPLADLAGAPPRVVAAAFLQEPATQADYVLPATTELERPARRGPGVGSCRTVFMARKRRRVYLSPFSSLAGDSFPDDGTGDRGANALLAAWSGPMLPADMVALVWRLRCAARRTVPE